MPASLRYLLIAPVWSAALGLAMGRLAPDGHFFTSVVLAVVFFFGLSLVADRYSSAGEPVLQSLGVAMAILLLGMGHSYGFARLQAGLFETTSAARVAGNVPGDAVSAGTADQSAAPATPTTVPTTRRAAFELEVRNRFGEDAKAGFGGYLRYVASYGYPGRTSEPPDRDGTWIRWLIQTAMLLYAGYASGSRHESSSSLGNERPPTSAQPARPLGQLSGPAYATPPTAKPRRNYPPANIPADLTREELDERLYLAARDGDLHLIDGLLERGADREFKSGDFMETPLLAAAAA